MNLVVTLIANGLLAGLFFAFACAIGPAFGCLDDRNYVHAFQAINAKILNGWFLSVFFLAPVTAVASAVVRVNHESPLVAASFVVGAACSVTTFLITAAANVPLNQALARAPIDTAQQQHTARERFESRWNRWNLAHALTSTAALALFTIPSFG